jgi:hypothetical protein
VADTDGCEGFGKRGRRSAECGKIKNKKKSHEEEEDPEEGTQPSLCIFRVLLGVIFSFFFLYTYIIKTIVT